MDREDLELFARSIRDATREYSGQTLDTALEQVGWYDALTIEPRAAIATLFEYQGANNATSSALGHVVLHTLGLGLTVEAAVVLPAIGQWHPPGTETDSGLQVQGLALADLLDREYALVIASAGPAESAFVVPTSSLMFTRVGGIDPHYGLWRVAGVDIHVTSDLRPAAPWTSAVALARLAIAHELVGASRTMLELAREHALERVQFGRPISSFQAVRHRLAETRVAIDMADAMLDAAWLEPTEETAAMAKAVAGRQARTAARHCQQVLAGIGFTTEHPLHLSLQRTILLDGLLGTALSLTRALGEQITSAGQLPPLLSL
jgi:hypothetical protein